MEIFISKSLGVLTVVVAIGALVLVSILAIRFARGEYQWKLPQVMKSPGVKDRGGRIVTVLVLWGIANVVLSWMVPDWWKWWLDRPNLFFHGSQLAIITLLLIQVVFKTEKNKPAINMLTAILLFFAIAGFAEEIGKTWSKSIPKTDGEIAGQIQRVVVKNLNFGLHPLSLEPDESSPRFCLPDGSDAKVKRANEKTMGFNYYLTPPGSTQEIKVERPVGEKNIRLPVSDCFRIVATTPLEGTIKVIPKPKKSG